jgi:hypothetical protein
MRKAVAFARSRLTNYVLRMKMKKKTATSTLVVIFLLYATCYLSLSLQGRYEPFIIGLAGVKSYLWAPRGLMTPDESPAWSRFKVYAFLPLFLVDTRLWHTSDKAYGDKYPVNRKLECSCEKTREKSKSTQATPSGSPD